jgi:hypothetical protein
VYKAERKGTFTLFVIDEGFRFCPTFSSRPKKRQNPHITEVTVFVSGSRVLAVFDGMFLLERRATLRRRHLKSYEAQIWRTAMMLINAYHVDQDEFVK